MARYIGPGGETFECTRLAEDTVVDGAGTVGRKGEWVLINPVGKLSLCVEAAFMQQFKPMYPRAADFVPEPVFAPGAA